MSKTTHTQKKINAEAVVQWIRYFILQTIVPPPLPMIYTLQANVARVDDGVDIFAELSVSATGMDGRVCRLVSSRDIAIVRERDPNVSGREYDKLRLSGE